MLKIPSLLGACMALFTLQATAQDFANERPNVVLIGLRELSDAMLEGSRTLKALASEGAVIQQSETGVPRGQPEMGVLMTGLLPQVTQLRLNSSHPKLGNATTLVDLLGSEGYATFGAGLSPAPWGDLSFEANHSEINPLSREGREALFGRIDELPAEQPFFLWWCPNSMGREKVAESIRYGKADEQLGYLIEGLKRSRRHSNTLYVIVNTRPPSNPADRQRSRNNRRTGPVVIVHPELVQAGKRHDFLATSLDLVPTILDYAQCSTEGLKLTGTSLRPMLERGESLERERVYGALYSNQEETVHPKSALDDDLRNLTQLYSRGRRWKYVLYLVDIRLVIDKSKLAFLFSSGDQELFDLEADPNEQRNLAGSPEHTKILKEHRQDLLKWWASTGAKRPPLSSLLTPLAPRRSGDRAKDPRPNIVLVISDDQDAAHLGFMGNDLAKTPVLDKLAAQGTVFTSVHATASRSRPALASLLSGRYPHQNKIIANAARLPLRPKNALPNLLKKAGYATFMGGRFHEDNRYTMGFTSPKWKDVNRFVRTDQESLMEFLDSQASKRPFFIWWAPKMPSEPFNAPLRLVRLFEDTKIKVPSDFKGSHLDFTQHELDVMAMEAWFDEGLGKLVKKIEDLGQMDNTLFCFLSDNGASNYRPSRGSVFESGLHTPVAFHLEGTIKAGQRVEALTSTLDIYPTLLEYAGVPIPKSSQGHSLRAVLEGSADESTHARKYLFGAGYRAPRLTGRSQPVKSLYALYARDAQWKYVFYVRNVNQENTSILAPVGLFPFRKIGAEELFDLSQDPNEFKNLARLPEHAARSAEMRAAAIEWWLNSGGQESKLFH